VFGVAYIIYILHIMFLLLLAILVDCLSVLLICLTRSFLSVLFHFSAMSSALSTTVAPIFSGVVWLP